MGIILISTSIKYCRNINPEASNIEKIIIICAINYFTCKNRNSLIKFYWLNTISIYSQKQLSQIIQTYNKIVLKIVNIEGDSCLIEFY